MVTPDLKGVLWANVLALMQKRYGRENLTRLARETGCGPGTASRIKARETSVGIDVLSQIAGAFEVQAWQLLVPGFDPDKLPTLKQVSEDERAALARLAADAQRIADMHQ